MLTNVIFIEGVMTQERWNQLAAAITKLGWEGRLFLTQEQRDLVSGRWTFQLVEAVTREGLTPQQSALLDAIEAGNAMTAQKGSPMARDLDALVELGLCGAISIGEAATTYAMKAKAVEPSSEPAS